MLAMTDPPYSLESTTSKQISPIDLHLFSSCSQVTEGSVETLERTDGMVRMDRGVPLALQDGLDPPDLRASRG